MLLKQLTKDAEAWLQSQGYTKSTIYHNFVRFWNRFCKAQGTDDGYSENQLRNYALQAFGIDLGTACPSSLPLKHYRAFHAFKSLAEFASTKEITGTSMKGASVRQPLTVKSQEALNRYMAHLSEQGYSSSSKRYAQQTVHCLLLSWPIEGASREGIISFLNGLGVHSKRTVDSMSKVIKRFLSFAYGEGITETDFSPAILSQKKRGGTEIPSVYTAEEIAKLMDFLSSHADNRKRNRAIVMAIAVFGFRAGDVAGLQMEDIDWDKGLIRVIQSKTGNLVEHQMTEAAGDSLADYLLNERPASEDPHVFLKQDGMPMDKTSISTMISSGFVNSGIDINGRKHGSHSLRHSLASNMLAEGEGILTISRTLGHGSVDSTRIYTKVDIGHLRLCELEVPAHE